MDMQWVKTKYMMLLSKGKPYWEVLQRWVRRLIWILPPLLVVLATLGVYKANFLYPFTNRTIAWCDMDQQFVPLLLDFKDILAGKEGFFLSFKNAGGMNFYGVFFFFLASPFNLLVAFVEKEDVSAFCNILVMLKMAGMALTASLYLWHKNKNAPLLNVALSILYAFSGYTMLYFQNVMWLDIAYLFPLLLWGLEKLQEGKRVLFILVLSLSMMMNYYLGYMLVVFLLLYALVWSLLAKDRKFAGNFCVSCAVSALLSAVVWLPCFWQYLSSGRTYSLVESLQYSSVLTHYPTTLPTILSVLFLLPFAFMQGNENNRRVQKILLIATLIPILIEPINKMWHTGNYMSFPTRYGFIPIFLTISLAYEGMSLPSKKEEKKGILQTSFLQNWKNEVPRYAVSVGLLLFSIFYYFFAKSYTNTHIGEMDDYAHSLWGSNQSLEALLGLYLLSALIGVVGYILWRSKLIKPVLLWVSVGVLVLSELYVSPMVYMVAPAHETTWYQEVVELADKIDNDAFYRVKTDREYSGHDFDVNLMGGIGYNALGHYTSLTPNNYMTAIKQFGYTSYWMEVGNSGGTILTDALLSVQYQISSRKKEGDLYQGQYFNIAQTMGALPLGIVTKKDVIALESSRQYTDRAELQNTLYNDILGTYKLPMYALTDAEAVSLTVEKEGDKYRLTPLNSNATLIFRLPITNKSRVYVNIFDENTNALNQAINEKFSVYSSKAFQASYPTQKCNGLIDVGSYSATTARIEVEVKESVLVKELSVFAIEEEKFMTDLSLTETLHLTQKNNCVRGRYETKCGECVFLSIPVSKGVRLSINGKAQKLYEVYDGFTAFYLEEGKNEISLTFTPQGFTFGLCMTIFGGALFALGALAWTLQKWRLTLPDYLDTIAYYGVIAIGILVVLAIYLLPLLLSAL